MLFSAPFQVLQYPFSGVTGSCVLGHAPGGRATTKALWPPADLCGLPPLPWLLLPSWLHSLEMPEVEMSDPLVRQSLHGEESGQGIVQILLILENLPKGEGGSERGAGL